MRSQAAFTITPARQPRELAEAAKLFADYARALGLDLSFQGFEAELATLPGKYAPPAGEILLACFADGLAAGCVALRPLTPSCCEMKRLFVAPQGRGLGLGRALVQAILATARGAGYAEMKLDTVASLASAVSLYRNAGFRPIPAYCENPFADAVFLGLRLSP